MFIVYSVFISKAYEKPPFFEIRTGLRGAFSLKKTQLILIYFYFSFIIFTTYFYYLSGAELMKVLENLSRRGFKPFFAESAEEVIQIIRQNVPAGSTIGFGGSQTCEALQVPQRLKALGYVCNHQLTSDLSWEALCQSNRFVDYYITSTNALTEDGQLVNTDGRSNRVSAMCYGPKKLFVVAGRNKICKDLPAAFERIEKVAAPLNAKRLNKKTPCAVTGKCEKCFSKDTICKATLILHNPTSTMEVFVIIVNRDLGF